LSRRGLAWGVGQGLSPFLCQGPLYDFRARQSLAWGRLECARPLSPVSRIFGQLLAKLGALVEQSHDGGELLLEEVELRDQHGFRAEHVADVAAELSDACPLLRAQDTAA